MWLRCVCVCAPCRWTKQIKNVLKLDPDGLLKQGMHPTPDMEIEFWKSKAANLNAVRAWGVRVCGCVCVWERGGVKLGLGACAHWVLRV